MSASARLSGYIWLGPWRRGGLYTGTFSNWRQPEECSLKCGYSQTRIHKQRITHYHGSASEKRANHSFDFSVRNRNKSFPSAISVVAGLPSSHESPSAWRSALSGTTPGTSDGPQTGMFKCEAESHPAGRGTPRSEMARTIWTSVAKSNNHAKRLIPARDSGTAAAFLATVR